MFINNTTVVTCSTLKLQVKYLTLRLCIFYLFTLLETRHSLSTPTVLFNVVYLHLKTRELCRTKSILRFKFVGLPLVLVLVALSHRSLKTVLHCSDQVDSVGVLAQIAHCVLPMPQRFCPAEPASYRRPLDFGDVLDFLSKGLIRASVAGWVAIAVLSTEFVVLSLHPPLLESRFA